MRGENGGCGTICAAARERDDSLRRVHGLFAAGSSAPTPNGTGWAIHDYENVDG